MQRPADITLELCTSCNAVRGKVDFLINHVGTWNLGGTQRVTDPKKKISDGNINPSGRRKVQKEVHDDVSFGVAQSLSPAKRCIRLCNMQALIDNNPKLFFHCPKIIRQVHREVYIHKPTFRLWAEKQPNWALCRKARSGHAKMSREKVRRSP